MEASLFLEQFGHLADSPGGVDKLRSLILELAVRGQLVPQNPDDKPASELLKWIEAEKKRLVKAGEIKPSKPLPPIREDEIPYGLPHGWVYVRLSQLGEFTGGGTPSKGNAEFWNGSIPWVSPKDMKSVYIDAAEMNITEQGVEGSSAKLIPVGSLLIVARSGILKRLLPVAINSVVCTVNQDIKVLIPHLHETVTFLRLLLKGHERHVLKNLVKTGTTVQSLKHDEFAVHPFPLPPLAEQQRIVAKVDELMALCDQLEAEQAARDHLRERTAKSTLYHLTDAPTRDEARRYWHSAEQNFPYLFDRSATVADLRATILQLAVQGRLMPQNPADEPASELLKRIEAEKKRLIKAGTIKPSKPLPPVTEDEIPYEVPGGWVWVRLGILCNMITDGTHHTPHYIASGVPFLSVRNISGGKLDFSDTRFISEEEHRRINQRCNPELGDILICRIGTLGKPVVVDDPRPFSIFVSVGLLKFNRDEVSSFFLRNAMSSPLLYQQYDEVKAGGSHTNKLNLQVLPILRIPLPPLAEQQRIVAKVDELMALCDQLEAQAEARQALSGRLFDSIVHHLLTPVG